MKERPVLFNGEMVRAILAGKKTQTRRPVKPQPTLSPAGGLVWRGGAYGLQPDWKTPATHAFVADCPLGIHGDRLWVRETWSTAATADTMAPSNLPSVAFEEDAVPVRYEADGSTNVPTSRMFGKARPSIHMPRWACRLFLDVTEVRVQRVEDITEADAKAEGFESREAFLTAWYQIYPAPNPWVWAVSFVWKRFCADHDDRAVEIAREEAEDG